MKCFLHILILFFVLTGNTYANEAEPEEPAPVPITPHELEPDPAMVEEQIQNPDQALPITLLNNTIAPGTFRTLHWSPGLSMTSLNTPVPVLVAHGVKPGPVLTGYRNTGDPDLRECGLSLFLKTNPAREIHRLMHTRFCVAYLSGLQPTLPIRPRTASGNDR